MLRSLVGSEMCIRDSPKPWNAQASCPFLIDTQNAIAPARPKRRPDKRSGLDDEAGGFFDGSISRVLYMGEDPAPVWKGKHHLANGEPAKREVAPWDKESRIPRGKGLMPEVCGTDGGVAGVVFGDGNGVLIRPSKPPKKAKNFIAKNVKNAPRTRDVRDKRGAVHPRIPRPSSKGNTARPEPLTGQGLWDNEI
eukprot:TRINITY_DN15322_c0_g1_i1.p1 TRINITY_DN15322_c0_g1~~TRINITY_DN15322_c0_g1_i1.p1  ORF type:complete len:194 (-),score=38.56 TRINITY_DN15322_c0_g1_i1:349-930(-)